MCEKLNIFLKEIGVSESSAKLIIQTLKTEDKCKQMIEYINYSENMRMFPSENNLINAACLMAQD